MPRFFRPQQPFAASVWVVLATALVGAADPAKAGPDLDPPAEANLDAAASERKGVDHWTLGAGAAVAPRFLGSDRYQAQPVPIVDVKVGRFFASSGDGIGFKVIDTPTITAGASVNWMRGYDDDDVPAGVQGVDDALGARLFVSARFRGAIATLAATQAITDSDRGLLINASLAYPIRATGRLTITPSVGVAWANDTYMDGYFGIDPSEAAASGLRGYQPSGGFRDVSVRVGVSYRVTDSITALGFLGAAHLLGEAANSPLVKRETQPMALFGLTYTF